MNTTQTGLAAIEQVFAKARAEHRATFMPYFTIGYPDLPTSLDAIEALVAAGGDILELGVPFSDPLADGPTVQHASQIALQNGITAAACIEAVRTLRARGVSAPMLLMGYINPMLAYGLERYARDAAAAGASGFIVPDLPPEEADELAGYCADNGLALIPLLAPTSTPDRIRQVVTKARGFLYLVGVTGVTGARDTLSADLGDYIRRVRSLTTLPLTVGFGISKPDQVKMIVNMADGVVVGSALLRSMETNGLDAVKKLAISLREACVTGR